MTGNLSGRGARVVALKRAAEQSAAQSYEERADYGVTSASPSITGTVILTVHGAGDDNVYVAQGERITTALRSRGADTEFVRIDGEEGNCHEDCWKASGARQAIHRFLARKLSHDGNGFYEQKRGTRSPRSIASHWQRS